MSAVLAAPVVVQSRAELAVALAGSRAAGQRIALVPTMGALHPGHLSLVESARRRVGPDGVVCLSIFVNPLQFEAGEDLETYPRTLEADLEACAASGVDVVWAPAYADVYGTAEGSGGEVTVDPGPLGAELEGVVRPTHFRGMLTVVANLFGAVRPDVAVFGEKDWQQLVLVRAMVDGLSLGVEVQAAPVDREHDGLARSSRNRYLDAAERVQAAAVPSALRAAAAAAPGGRAAVVAAAREQLEGAGLAIDYVALRTPDLREEPELGPARLLVAVRCGSTRLIDNRPIDLPPA